MTRADQAATVLDAAQGALSVERLEGLDLLRVLAVAGIVWFHIEAPEYQIAYSGLAVFVLISIALQAMRPQPRFRALLLKRAGRLLVPWLFWCGIFALAHVARCVREPTRWREIFQGAWPLIGTAPHLWYPPFALLAALVAKGIEAAWQWHGRPARNYPLLSALCLAAGVALLWIYPRIPYGSLPLPFPQWKYCAAAIPIGFAIGVAMTTTGEAPVLRLAAIAAVIMAACILIRLRTPSDQALGYLIATPVVCAAFLWRGRLPRIVGSLGALVFGVYLMHPLLITLAKGLARSRWDDMRIRMAAVVFITIASFAIVALLRKTRLKRFLG